LGRLAYQRGQLSVKQPLKALQVRIGARLTKSMESKPVRGWVLFAKQMEFNCLWFESTALRL